MMRPRRSSAIPTILPICCLLPLLPLLFFTLQPRLEPQNPHALPPTRFSDPPTLPISHYVDEAENKLIAHDGRQQDLINFVVVGFPKTGTSFLQNAWLSRHPGVCMPKHEVRAWRRQPNPEVATAMELYNLTKRSSTTTSDDANSCILRGYKDPAQARSPVALNMLSTFWPKAKLIVGVRHPVWWFQSLYNFKQRPELTESKRRVISPPETLRKGHCENNVCTDNAQYHLFLSLLGKTNQSTADELSLLQEQSGAPVAAVPNPVFLYELSQLDADKNPSVADELRHDLSKFLGLNDPLPPLVRKARTKARPNRFDICSDQYQELRSELVEIGTNAADWILNHFALSSDVTISSRASFEQELHKWRHDPCAQRDDLEAGEQWKEIKTE